MITLEGTLITETGTIDNVTTIGTAVSEMPTSVTTVFTNTGNHHYYGASNQIVVKDNAGNVVFNSTSPPLNTAIVPGGTVGFTQTISKGLSADTYTLISSVLRSDGTVLDTNTTSFTVSAAQTASPTESMAQPGNTQASSSAVSASPTGVQATATTHSPLGLPLIIAGCALAVGIFGMRRKFE
jgi:hypothetical protein